MDTLEMDTNLGGGGLGMKNKEDVKMCRNVTIFMIYFGGEIQDASSIMGMSWLLVRGKH